MNKMGKTFSRDMEFTGSVDAPANVGGRLMESLRSKGFDVTRQGVRQDTIRTGNLRFPEVKGYMEGIEEKTTTIDLNDDQRKKVRDVLGWTPSKVQVSIVTSEKNQDIPLTKDQQKALDNALGIQIASLSVSREPIEITLK